MYEGQKFFEEKSKQKIDYWKTEEQKQQERELEEKRKQEIEKLDFTYEELHDLDNNIKDDYMKKILEEDQQTTQYIKRILTRMEKAHDEIVES